MKEGWHTKMTVVEMKQNFRFNFHRIEFAPGLSVSIQVENPNIREVHFVHRVPAIVHVSLTDHATSQQ